MLKISFHYNFCQERPANLAGLNEKMKKRDIQCTIEAMYDRWRADQDKNKEAVIGPYGPSDSLLLRFFFIRQKFSCNEPASSDLHR
jgi:hypothetical protein